MKHEHWDNLLDHIGSGLDDAVRANPWCQQNGITTGGAYLLYWCASLFQRPDQKLPYLFIYGVSEGGKSSLHNALSLLMSKGHVEARNSLLTDHNAELDGAILAYIEEVDLSGKREDVYNRIKDLVTADKITINPKYVNAYSVKSYAHWIQCSNKRHHCPIFDDDTRIVVIHVPEKPDEDLAWREVLCPRLLHEAPDFIRTLVDLPLPEGTKRLWLPVLDTEAKRQAIAGEETQQRSVKQALENALALFLLDRMSDRYESLVADLLGKLGKGPWSSDPGVFGKQLKAVLEDSWKRGIQGNVKRTNEGSYVSLREVCDTTNMDVADEWLQQALAEEYASAQPVVSATGEQSEQSSSQVCAAADPSLCFSPLSTATEPIGQPDVHAESK